ncbi:MAG TPA: GNAT family N-acetyltransferase, partial [Pseudoxanthomonas sp.]|nr:GNAT family N-acetyltransferase [Pseudoxanthomonas sp.]
WQDAHARILPAELARHRTLESFRRRLQSVLPDVRVAGPPNQPLGLCITNDDELYQLYVTAGARGSGLAAALLADAEERFNALGIQTAWLACAIGNERAGKFYEKHGWRRIGNMISQLPTPDGLFPLEVWRYEKDLGEIPRPSVGVAHVVLETDCMERSSQFMRIIGMRPIFDGPEVSVYEMRGGTHLILMRKERAMAGNASFDLMVDDLHATHERFKSIGLVPSPIEARPAIDHEVFTVREPAGHVITFFSSHASGKPT